jgi:GTP diphosphokinase / guanosine-3',5'-bis(diphosphate) 3'-diphosphatase
MTNPTGLYPADALIYEAMVLARRLHSHQARKYTGNPYIEHLGEVAGIAASVADQYPDVRREMVAIAWLHDAVEDQGLTHDELLRRFGSVVADGVLKLSDLEEGNRAHRKAASRLRLAAAPDYIQSIKCGDVISNTGSIEIHATDFATQYLGEKRLLLGVLAKAHPGLLAVARQQCAGRSQPADASASVLQERFVTS